MSFSSDHTVLTDGVFLGSKFWSSVSHEAGNLDELHGNFDAEDRGGLVIGTSGCK
jgi:hypothetical protein